MPASGAEDTDANNAPAAYNQSIYLMVGVPYLSLSVLSFMIYRGCKKNAAYFRAIDKSSETGQATEPRT